MMKEIAQRSSNAVEILSKKPIEIRPWEEYPEARAHNSIGKLESSGSTFGW